MPERLPKFSSVDAPRIGRGRGSVPGRVTTLERCNEVDGASRERSSIGETRESGCCAGESLATKNDRIALIEVIE